MFLWNQRGEFQPYPTVSSVLPLVNPLVNEDVWVEESVVSGCNANYIIHICASATEVGTL